jgi:hypothetical protein
MSQPPYEPPAAQEPEEPGPDGRTPGPQGLPPPPPTLPHSPRQGPPPGSPYGPPPGSPYGPVTGGAWQPAGPPPPRGGRRYERGVVAISAVVTVIGLIAVVIGSTVIMAGLAGLLVVPVLLVVAIVLSIVSKSTRPRSIWLGVVIGCGIDLVVGGGLCVALIASLGI